MFTSLKDMRKGGNNLSAMVNKVVEMEKKSFEKADEGAFWSPSVDKAGNGYAVIRFLPEPKGEEFPFQRRYDHGFQGPTGKWYIENSLTTLGAVDPVSEDNSRLWNLTPDSAGDETPNRKLAKVRKRRLNYYSNILIVKDPARPENEGKVFLFKYGAKIFAKPKNAMSPPVEGMAKFNPFNPWEGADLELIICKVAGYRNYDQSKFNNCSAISSDDAVIEGLWEQCQSLTEFIDPKRFKSYEDLKKRFELVTGGSTVPSIDLPSEKGVEAKSESRAPAKSMKVKEEEAEDEEIEDTEAYFKNLATKP